MAKTLPVPTLLSVTVFVHNAGDVLLMKRSPHRSHEPNKYCGVGGKVDPGETILDTAIRETLDETGLEFSPDQLTFRGSLILDGYPDARWVVNLFDAWTEERSVKQTDEGELLWVPQDKVLETDLMDDIRLYLPTYFASDKPIFGHFLFDGNGTVIEHKLTAIPTLVTA